MSTRSASLRPLILVIIIVALAWNFFFKKEIPTPSGSSAVLNAQVCFTPGGNCTERIVAALGQTQKNIYVQAYSFTSAPIAKALVDAAKRGVQVEIILDESQEKEKYSSLDFFTKAGIATRVDHAHSIAHNKIMILDALYVFTGSFNFTKAAQEKNAENILLLKDPTLAKLYLDNWKIHQGHSDLLTAKN